MARELSSYLDDEVGLPTDYIEEGYGRVYELEEMDIAERIMASVKRKSRRWSTSLTNSIGWLFDKPGPEAIDTKQYLIMERERRAPVGVLMFGSIESTELTTGAECCTETPAASTEMVVYTPKVGADTANISPYINIGGQEQPKLIPYHIQVLGLTGSYQGGNETHTAPTTELRSDHRTQRGVAQLVHNNVEEEYHRRIRRRQSRPFINAMVKVAKVKFGGVPKTTEANRLAVHAYVAGELSKKIGLRRSEASRVLPLIVSLTFIPSKAERVAAGLLTSRLSCELRKQFSKSKIAAGFGSDP